VDAYKPPQGGNPQCLSGNAGEHTPRLAPGKQRTILPFRCSAAQPGVTRIVIKTGKGFFISRQ
jgi:hypothetical protein